MYQNRKRLPKRINRHSQSCGRNKQILVPEALFQSYRNNERSNIMLAQFKEHNTIYLNQIGIAAMILSQ